MIKPIIYKSLKYLPRKTKVLDAFNGSLKELFFVRNPNYKEGMPQAKIPFRDFLKTMRNLKPLFVYFPWRKEAVKILPEELFFEVKTARNKSFITWQEQYRYRKLKVGILGMSIGSNIIWPLVASGGPKLLRIADSDTIELSNLNRLLAPIWAIGENKAIFMTKRIYEMDPFLKVDCWTENVSKDNLRRFISGPEKINVLIDEMDNLRLKFLVREAAKKSKTCVLMATNVGNNVVLDVERYDLNSKYPVFHGMFKDLEPKKLRSLSFLEWVKVATKIAGPRNLSPKMKKAVESIGKSVAGVPQISPTALIAGSLIASCLIKIANGQSLESGRYFFNFDKKF